MRNPATQDERYREAVRVFGADPARRHELLQEVHSALWQSFAGFEDQCALRTWVYRVAHNVGVSHVQRSVRRADRGALSLDEAEAVPDDRADVSVTDRRLDLQRVMGLVHSLRPFDRQLMLLYLQDLHRRRSNRSRSQQGRPRARQAHSLQRE